MPLNMGQADIHMLYDFIKEINKYKSVERLALVKENGRKESDAEHAWHLAVSAWILARYYEKELNLLKILKLALVHDLVELYAGDVFAFDMTKRSGKEGREKAAMQKIKQQLPKNIGDEFECFWQEYEEKRTEEAKYVWAMDKIMPRISWLLSRGDSTDTMLQDHEKAEEQKKKLRETDKIFGDILDMLEEDRKVSFTNKSRPKVYITASYEGINNKDEIEKLCSIVRASGFSDFYFTRDIEGYQHVFDDPKELMQRSLEEIHNCDFLLIDMTDKPTGRAYEAGMAYAMEKRIIAIMKRGTQIKVTTEGIADIVIEYDEIEDILPPLKKYLSSLGRK